MVVADRHPVRQHKVSLDTCRGARYVAPTKGSNTMNDLHIFTNGEPITPTVKHWTASDKHHGFYVLQLEVGDTRVKLFLPDDGEYVSELRNRIFTTPVQVDSHDG
jgi:hypothetical protein